MAGLLPWDKGAGLKLSTKDCFIALHNLLLAHGQSVRALRICKKNNKSRLCKYRSVAYPADYNLANEAAAFHATFNVFGSEKINIPTIIGIVQLIHCGILLGIPADISR